MPSVCQREKNMLSSSSLLFLCTNSSLSWGQLILFLEPGLCIGWVSPERLHCFFLKQMLFLSCMSSAIIAEWTDMQSQVLSQTGVTPSISVDMQHFMLVGNLAHCVLKGWNCLDLSSFLIWYRSKKFLHCATRKSSMLQILPFPPVFQHWWKLSSSSVICNVCFLYGISALQENQIWQSRLIMMQIQTVGRWWACCHKCLPRSRLFFFCPVFCL